MVKILYIRLMKYVILTLIAAFIIIQFFRIDKSVPETNDSDDFIAMTDPPEEVKNILLKACYDCHSYKTTYPWYAEVAPSSWWLANHIEEGREHLNYSLWGKNDLKRKKHKIEEMIEEVEEGEMPLKSYTLAHWDASLSDDEKEMLVKWLKGIK